MKIWRKFVAKAMPSIENAKKANFAKNRDQPGSPFMYPMA